MNISFERWYPLLGIILGILPLLNWAKTSEIELEILSMIFGGLLATAAIVQGSWDSKTLKRLRISGHDKYLIEYITVPLYACFVLLILQLFERMTSVQLPSDFAKTGSVLFGSVTFGFLGIMLLSTLRLLLLINPIMKKAND